jgi:hypothetical protein
MQRKPEVSAGDIEHFIAGAVEEKLVKAVSPVKEGKAASSEPDAPKPSKPARTAQKKEAKGEAIIMEDIFSYKTKKFPLNIPPPLHEAAERAAEECSPKLPLHDYILVAIKEKVERDRKK